MLRSCTRLIYGIVIIIMLGASISNAAQETEPNNTTTTANLLTLGSISTGTLSSSSDIDCFSFKLFGDGLVTLTFEHNQITTNSSNIYYEVTIQDDSNNTVLYIPSTGTMTSLVRHIGLRGIANTGKNYFVTVRPNAYSSTPYSVRVDYTSGSYELESNDAADATATPLPIGTPTTGYLQKQDRGNSTYDYDYYSFTLTQPGLVTLSLDHDPISLNSTSMYYQVSLLNSAGSSQLFIPSYGTTTHLSRRIGLPSGTYYVKVSPDALPWDTGTDPAYTVKVDFTAGNYELESNDTADATATPLTIGTPRTGYLQKQDRGNSSYDHDYYSFTLTQPGLVTISFDHDPISLKSTYMYYQVSLSNSAGSSLLFIPSYWTTTHLSRRIGLPPGTYYIKVSPDALPWETGTDPAYTVKVDFTAGNYELESNDAADATATPLPIGTPTTGYLQKQDRGNSIYDYDYYSFTLTQPGLVTLSFDHDPISLTSTYMYYQVSLSNSAGSSLLFIPSYWTTNHLSRRIGLPSGTYYVKVSPDALPWETGTDPAYTVKVDFTAGNYELEGNDTADATATPLTLGTPTTGYLQKRDIYNSIHEKDFYSFTLTQQGDVTIDFSHETISSTGTWWTISLLDELGTPLRNFTASGTANITNSATDLPGNKKYYVKVSWGDNFADDKEYVLLVSAVPAQTIITEKPATLVAQKNAKFSFISSDPQATFECKIDAGTFSACASPYDILNLAEGSHSFAVRSVINGTPDPNPPYHIWTVDTTPPTVSITSQPSAQSSQDSGIIQFAANEPGCLFECSLNGGGFADCSSPFRFSGWQEGNYQFDVRAIDKAGNISNSARSSWVIDLPPIGTSIISASANGMTTESQASFSFTCDDPSANSFECSLDGSSFQSCTSPLIYTSIADGNHVFRVRAVDASGNGDPNPASHSWSVGQYIKLLVSGTPHSYHFTIYDAYTSLNQEPGVTDAEIQLKGRAFTESVENGLQFPVKLVGGFGHNFYNQTEGSSSILAPLSLLDGQLIIDSIIVK